MDLKVGDIIDWTQKDGKRISIHLYEDGVGVKADTVGTKLEIRRDGKFWVKAKAANE